MQEQENCNQPQTQASVPASSQPQMLPVAPKKKWIKPLIITVVVIVYTAVVVISTVLIDREIIKKRIQEEIVNNLTFEIGGSVDVDSESEKVNNGVNVKSAELNKKITVGSMFEITLLKSEWCEEIRPSNTTDRYTYYTDEEGQKYFVIRAKIKNVSSKEVDFENISKCLLKADGKYEISGKAESEKTDGTSFYGTIKPLQEVNAVIYFSVSDEMYNTCSNYEVFLDVVNNEDAADQYDFNRENDDYDSFKIMFKK